MLKVGDIHSIKRLHYSQGWGKRRISRELSIARNTVRDVLSGENDGQYTMKQPRARPVAEVIEPIVRNYLKAELEDPQPHRKQRLTAARIDELLRTQHGFSGGDRTVRRVVSKVRSELADPLQVAMVPLVYEPGRDAQVDFLEADVDYPEGRVRKTFMLVRACYSTRTFAAAVPAENQEALFEALMKSFEHFGGVFHYLGSTTSPRPWTGCSRAASASCAGATSHSGPTTASMTSSVVRARATRRVAWRRTSTTSGAAA